MNNHTKFRTKKVWKDFRYTMLYRNSNTCELCGTQYAGKRCKMLQVHHLKPDMYDYLEPVHFKVICTPCHDLIERFTIKKSWGKYKEIWKALLYDFIADNVKKRLK